MNTTPTPARRHTGSFIEMGVSSLLSLIASLVLSVEAWILAGDPEATFSCDVSSKISCTQVALTWQAHLLGFPNAFLGLIFESIVLTFVAASLWRVRFPRGFMIGLQALYTIALFFAYWLFLQAYFVIGALCPWCLLVTITTTFVFTSMLRVNILDGNIRFGRFTPLAQKWVGLGADVWTSVLLTGIIAAAVIYRYL